MLVDKKINLGLDLRGGISLLMEADMPHYMNEHMTNISEELRKIVNDNKSVEKMNIDKKTHSVTMKLNKPISEQMKQDLRKYNANYTVTYEENDVTLKYTDEFLESLADNVIGQSIENIRKRIDDLGTKEVAIQRQGQSRILVQVPGLSDPSEIKSVLGKTAKLSFHLVDNRTVALTKINRATTQILYTQQNIPMPIFKKSIISGDMLTGAKAGLNHNGTPAVFFEFDSVGTKRFAQVTKENTGKLFAIVLDNKILTAPAIREPITGGSGEITGGFTIETANELAILLRAGALPTQLNIMEERVIGPTLGQKSIELGKNAAAVAMVLVVAFMILIYRLYGLFASIALAANMLFIMAIMSLLQVTLTLPGIAGLILTVGMAVDANVLIFERIKEEKAAGKSLLKSIEQGFQHAVATIMDSNITTLIGALVMFVVGSGSIKGFAITLSIGIICSMFSAIFITKVLILTTVKKS